MNSNWVAFALLFVCISPALVWLGRRIRHPTQFVDTPGLTWQILQAFFIGSGLLLVLWLFLAWITHALATGHLTPLLPKISPWQRLTVGRRFRPWNLYALGALYLALSGVVLSLLLLQLRTIRNSLQRVAGEFDLTFIRRASREVANWLTTHSGFSIVTAVDNARGGDPIEKDWLLILNPCWAVHPKRDSRRLLVTSYGPEAKHSNYYRSAVIWVCLYACDIEHGTPGISDEAQQNLRAKGFDVKRCAGFVRISDQRYCIPTNVWTIRKATAPARLIELWRLTEPPF